MASIITLVLALFFLLIAIQFGTLALAFWRLKRSPKLDKTNQPFIALIRPLCGVDSFEEETLLSSFQQDYPNYEILFCVASANDPVIPLAEKAIANHPEQQARLLIGDDLITVNPKVNNVAKGWHATKADWIVMSDSNQILPPDYLTLLMATFDEHTGMVSTPAVGVRPRNLWGAVEAAMLNTHQIRWQYLADLFGFGFAQGKTLCYRREIIDNNGGLEALGDEMAEDVASTKIVRRAGFKVRLPPHPFPHPVGQRSFDDVWDRQLRWSRIRRFGFLWVFLPEIFVGAIPALICAIYLANADVFSWLVPPALLVVWYGAEWLMAKLLNWPHTLRDVFAMFIRDSMLPLLWVWCWAGKGFVWRGNAVKVNKRLAAYQPERK